MRRHPLERRGARAGEPWSRVRRDGLPLRVQKGGPLLAAPPALHARWQGALLLRTRAGLSSLLNPEAYR